MDTLLDIKKKKLFDEAYQAYLNITRQIEDMYSEGMVDPLADEPSVTDMVCSLDMFLQGCLLRIGVSDGTLSPEELYFISALPDEFDEVCARNRGYKRFLKMITVDRFNSDYAKYFDFDKKPLFLEILEQDFDEAPMMVRSNLQIIFNDFIAIDGAFSECEADIALAILDKIDNGTKEYASLKEDDERSSTDSCVPVPSKKSASVNAINKNIITVEDTDLESCLDELEALVGLEGVKKEVLACINLLRINSMRREKGLPELQTSNHMVFTGHPGTGKTTVARIMAKIYKSLGVVSKGQLIETDRSGLVAGYMGQTALKTAQVIKKAKGASCIIQI